MEIGRGFRRGVVYPEIFNAVVPPHGGGVEHILSGPGEKGFNVFVEQGQIA